MKAEALESLLHPQSIAVIGASPTSFVGRIAVENLRRLGYAGRVYPVNPKYAEVLGWRCYPHVADIPGEVEAAVVALPPRHVLPAIRAAADKGLRAVVVPAGGFAGSGEAGQSLQDQLAAFCRERDIALLGPNCMGAIHPSGRAALYIGALPPTLRPGPLGAVLQSGSICEALINEGGRLGFSAILSTGNEAVVAAEDCLEYLLDDPDTRVVVCFFEGLRQPQRFLQLADRARQLGKPIIVMKAGRSAGARQLAAGHTGALAGSDAVHEAAFRQKGITRVYDLDELIETAALFAAGRRPPAGAPGVGALTFSGGEAALLLDLGDELGLGFPPLAPETQARLRAALPGLVNITNPLDPWGSHDYREFVPACLDALAADPAMGVILINVDLPEAQGEDESRAARFCAEAALALAERTTHPIVYVSNLSGPLDRAVFEMLRGSPVPLLQGTRESLRAVRSLLRYSTPPPEGANAPRLRFAPDGEPLEDFDVARARLHSWIFDALLPTGASAGQFTEYLSRRVLEAGGLPVVPDGLAQTPDEAVALAERLGYPVALKINSPDLPHKSEVGGVRLSLPWAGAVRAAYQHIIADAQRHAPQARLDGVLVSKMAPPGVELIVGVRRDPQFGPVVLFGMGGVFAEILRDTSLRLAPLTRAEAEAMIAETRGAALLTGARGRPPADVPALVEALVRLSHLAAALDGEYTEIEINPLIALPAGQGVVAVDALIRR